MIRRAAPSLCLAVMLSACVAGPTYKAPPVAASLPQHFAGAEALPAASAPEPAQRAWWALFHDPILDELEERALAGNPGLAIAEARVRGARASLRLERANGLPRVNPQLSTIQAHLPGVDLNQGGQASGAADNDFDFYNAGFDASWEVDLFGGQRRRVEASRATLGAIEADSADARLTLTADVAMAYAELRERQQRIALAQADAVLRHKSLALLDQRFDRGAASPLDVQTMRAMVETADAELPPLRAEAQARIDALAILTGGMPGTLDPTLSAPSALLSPPAAVQVDDPASLLRRRPDIRAAERRLAAETARIGVARAARFPRVRLLGVIGLGGSDPSDLGDIDKVAVLAAPALQWDILDFGRGLARVRSAEAKRDEAEAAYRKTVLSALRDAQDALARFGQRRLALAALVRASDAAGKARSLTRQRYDAGTVTLLDVNESERQAIAAEQRLATARALLSIDFIALQKALGLGYLPPSQPGDGPQG